MNVEARTENIDLRVNKSEKSLIVEAAKANGQTVTEFVKTTILPVARAIVEDRNTIRLSVTAWNDFWDRMVENPAPPPELAKQEAAEFYAEWEANNNL